MADFGFTNIRLTNGKQENIERAKSPYHKPTKNFRKVLAKDRKEQDEEHKQEEVKKSKDRPTKKLVARNKPQAEKKESIFDLAKDTPVERGQKTEYEKDQFEDDYAAGDVYTEETAEMSTLEQPKERESKGEEKVAPKFAREQPDLAAINPVAVAEATLSAIQGSETAASIRSTDLVEIVEKLIDKLMIAEKEGLTETTITIKDSATFRGAKLTITEFDHAKGEFNLKFENLTPKAKEIVDFAENRSALQAAMEQKGYVVHIVTATTFVEAPKEVEGEALARDGREESDEEGNREREGEREGEGTA